MSLSLNDAYGQVAQLVTTLQRVVDKDQEQEVLEFALPVIDAALAVGRAVLPEDDPILGSISDVITADRIGAGETVRALEVLMVAEQLQARLQSLLDQETRNRGPVVG